jgi:hypothetical protein|tara:strand:- start:497 stop:1693 length:1197 start_codon:yes stop_codon:yes gene_type:complete
MSTTFFTKVARHNLERFHSECIAWVLNRMPKDNKIFKKFKAGNDFEFVKAVAEVQQHDIVLLFKNSENKFKYVFVENKTKSTLSRNKTWSKYLNQESITLNTHKKRIIENEGMLQTSYYQLRWCEKMKDLTYCKGVFDAFEFSENWNKNEGKNQLERIRVEFDRIANPEWVILSQMDLGIFKGIYDNEYNLKGTKEILEIENNQESEWSYLTYKDLFKNIKLPSLPSKEYVDNILINEYVYHAQNIPSEDEDTTLSKFIKLKKEILGENIDDIEIQISVGSANGKGAMIQIYKVIKFPNEICVIENLVEGSLMSIGIQIEGDTFKYKMSAEDYEKTSITGAEKVKYNVVCKKYLNDVLIGVEGIGFNQSKGKSHCSFTYKDNSDLDYKSLILDFLNKI